MDGRPGSTEEHQLATLKVLVDSQFPVYSLPTPPPTVISFEIHNKRDSGSSSTSIELFVCSFQEWQLVISYCIGNT